MGLAEPKRKQRIVPDARGMALTRDSEYAGYKMLKSLGWTDGKGLGRGGSGNPNLIAVSLKSDKLGLGADRKTADNWLDNTFAFSALLENLNKPDGASEASSPPAAPEVSSAAKKRKLATDAAGSEPVDQASGKKKKGKKCSGGDNEGGPSENQPPEPTTKVEAVTQGGRLLHRKRFLANKDVRSFSEEAINKILGVKKPTTSTEPAAASPAEEADDAPSPAATVETSNVITSRLAMSDYFASKAAARFGTALFPAPARNSPPQYRSNDDEEDDLDARPRLGLGATATATPAATTSAGGLRFGGAALLAHCDESARSLPVRSESAVEGLDGVSMYAAGRRTLSSFVKASAASAIDFLGTDSRTAADSATGKTADAVVGESAVDEKEKKKKKKKKKRKAEVDDASNGTGSPAANGAAESTSAAFETDGKDAGGDKKTKKRKAMTVDTSETGADAPLVETAPVDAPEAPAVSSRKRKKRKDTGSGEGPAADEPVANAGEKRDKEESSATTTAGGEDGTSKKEEKKKKRKDARARV
ncbi:hypothetical protein DFJ73DRAFT_835927 [Zopfochytrium polystomum]|nr:hypothetical protein DFJ73DRAFT_835927 [Zopfochytrium polystomum]